MPTPPIPYPLINGVRFDWSSVEIKAAGRLFDGVKGLDYSQTLEPGKARGNRAQVVGSTRGVLDADGKITLYRLEFDALIAHLVATGGGRGFMEVMFDINASYADINQPTTNDVLKGVRIKKHSHTGTEGGDPLAVECELFVMSVWPNGVPPIGGRQFLR